jgi:hypothetical protein
VATAPLNLLKQRAAGVGRTVETVADGSGNRAAHAGKADAGGEQSGQDDHAHVSFLQFACARARTGRSGCGKASLPFI